jgi:UDP-2,3-diacylglucosamine hydrolase
LDLPRFDRVDAPPDWRAIEFISDLHLSAAEPATFDAWAAYMRDTQANAVFILGDLFDAWVGDDARHEGFERDCASVLRAAAAQRTVGFMAGNRDFLVGPALLADTGVLGLRDPTLVSAWSWRVVLTHGDALCLSDVDYQRFRAQVRSPEWQRSFLALPLAERRAAARRMRDASEAAQRSHEGPYADVDPTAAAAWLHAAGADQMVHGHTHRPGSDTLAPGLHRHVLSDWDLVARPPRAEVLRLTAEGFARVPATR